MGSDATNQRKDDPLRKVRGEHCVNVHVSFEIKEQLKALADRYDRTMSDMVRAVLRVGIPMMQGLSEAEEVMVREYIDLFRRLRQVRSIKDI
jgi:predicted DNA-binding protein